MPIEGELKKVSLTSKSTTASTIDDVVKVEEFDGDTKKKLEESLFASDMGKKLEKMLESIQQENSEENRRDRLVLLLNDFFEVGDDKDELVQRLVVDGKTYVRFAMGDESFDVELSDVLMPSLVDWYIELATSRVNSGFEDDKKIALKYEKVQEFIVKTQEELTTLQTQVTGGAAVAASSGTTKGLKREDVWGVFKTGDMSGGFSKLSSYIGQYFTFGITAATATSSLAGLFTKDKAKLQKTQENTKGIIASLTRAKDAVVNAFTPSTPPQGTPA